MVISEVRMKQRMGSKPRRVVSLFKKEVSSQYHDQTSNKALNKVLLFFASPGTRGLFQVKKK